MKGEIEGLLLGYGSIGRRHAEVLAQAFPKLTIVDTKREARERASEEHPTAYVFDSLESLRESNWKPSRSVATIATWGPSHSELFHALVDSGVRSILCEKPLAGSVKAAQDMVRRAELEKVSMAVHHFMRYAALPKALRDISIQYELGNPVSLVVEGGAAGIVTNGIHWIDLASDLFDSEPLQVISTAAGENINPRSPDVQLFGGSVTWLFVGGREAVVSFNNHSSVWMTGRIYYRNAMVEIDPELNVIVRKRNMRIVKEFPSVTRTGALTEQIFEGQLPGVRSLADGIKLALSEIQCSGVITVSGSDGAAAVSNCVGALIAARKGSAVALPIDPESLEGKESWPIS